MSLNDLVRYFFSWVSLPTLAVLAGIFLWRRLYKEFPLFFSYIIVISFVTIIRLVAYSMVTQESYSYLYWISSIVGSALAIMAVIEVFLRRLFAGFVRVRLYRILFPAVALIITLCAIFTALFSPDKWAVFGVTDRVVTFVRVAFLGFFVALMLLMGRHWTKYELAISFGFSIHAAASFFTSAMWVHPRYRNSVVNDLPRIAWDIACFIWLLSFGKAEKPVDVVSTTPLTETLSEAKKLEKTLKDWLTFRGH